MCQYEIVTGSSLAEADGPALEDAGDDPLGEDAGVLGAAEDGLAPPLSLLPPQADRAAIVKADASIRAKLFFWFIVSLTSHIRSNYFEAEPSCLNLDREKPHHPSLVGATVNLSRPSALRLR
jgi:hypothetical protein